MLCSFVGQVMVDCEGFGFSGNVWFEYLFVYGDVYVQRMLQEGYVGGGFNLESIIVFGVGWLVVIGVVLGGSVDMGMIVDVSFDFFDVVFCVDDSWGGLYVLWLGCNFVLVVVYGSGVLQIDFEGCVVLVVVIQFGCLFYYFNKGGVVYGKVDIVLIVIVMGWLQDVGGQLFGGVYIYNYVGCSVVEVDGFFILELSVCFFVLQVCYLWVQDCMFVLDGMVM